MRFPFAAGDWPLLCKISEGRLKLLLFASPSRGLWANAFKNVAAIVLHDAKSGRACFSFLSAYSAKTCCHPKPGQAFLSSFFSSAPYVPLPAASDFLSFLSHPAPCVAPVPSARDPSAARVPPVPAPPALLPLLLPFFCPLFCRPSSLLLPLLLLLLLALSCHSCYFSGPAACPVPLPSSAPLACCLPCPFCPSCLSHPSAPRVSLLLSLPLLRPISGHSRLLVGCSQNGRRA